MYSSTEKFYIVRVKVGSLMLHDGEGKHYAYKDEAVARAKVCASEGEYAEVREVKIVQTERMLERF